MDNFNFNPPPMPEIKNYGKIIEENNQLLKEIVPFMKQLAEANKELLQTNRELLERLQLLQPVNN